MVTTVCDTIASSLFLVAPLLIICLSILATTMTNRPAQGVTRNILDTFFISVGIILGQTPEKSLRIKLVNSRWLLKFLLIFTGFFMMTMLVNMLDFL